MLLPIQPGGHQHGCRKPRETSVSEFCYKSAKWSVQKHLSSTFSNTLTVQMAKFPEISHFFNQHDSSFGRHVNATPRKTLVTSIFKVSQKTKCLLFTIQNEWGTPSTFISEITHPTFRSLLSFLYILLPSPVPTHLHWLLVVLLTLLTAVIHREIITGVFTLVLDF